MKMVIISFIFLVIMIFIWGWFHYSSIDLVTSYFDNNLIELSYAVSHGDWDEAGKNMLLHKTKWQEARSLWIYFINQKDINEIDKSLNMLVVYINGFDRTLSLSEIERLRVLFKVIKENECLSLDNVF